MNQVGEKQVPYCSCLRTADSICKHTSNSRAHMTLVRSCDSGRGTWQRCCRLLCVTTSRFARSFHRSCEERIFLGSLVTQVQGFNVQVSVGSGVFRLLHYVLKFHTSSSLLDPMHTAHRASRGAPAWPTHVWSVHSCSNSVLLEDLSCRSHCHHGTWGGGCCS